MCNGDFQKARSSARAEVCSESDLVFTEELCFGIYFMYLHLSILTATR